MDGGVHGGFATFPGQDNSAQIITALRSLGLGVFPFSSFDVQGRLVSEPNVDPDLKHQLEDVLASPDWVRLFSSLSLFDNPGHNASWLGFELDNKGANIVAVRSVDTLSAPSKAGQWYLALADNLLARVQEAAGKAYYVKPSWIEAIRKILGLLNARAAGLESVAYSEEKREELRTFIGVKAAIEFILGVLEIANMFGRRHTVSCAVVWEYGYFKPATTPDVLAKWSSVGSVVNQGGRNVAGVLWDVAKRETWHWSKSYPWYGLRISPQSIYRAWYPSGLLSDAPADASAGVDGGDPSAGPAPDGDGRSGEQT